AACVVATAALLPNPDRWPPRAKPQQDAQRSDATPEKDPGKEGESPVVRGRTVDREELSMEDEIRALPPTVRLHKELAKELRDELDRVKPALQQACRLAELPRGRYQIEWSRDYFSTKL